jgi:hypothetical protein
MPSPEDWLPDSLVEMTLEEIERESAKLSEEERVRLASRLLDGRDSPVPEPGQCCCPNCKKPTKRIEIEVESADWARVFFFGILGALFPDKERGRVCEHCGHVFDRSLVTNPVADRILTLAFFAMMGAVIIGVIAMLVRATME